jgi:pantoate--beta-alanine ligase
MSIFVNPAQFAPHEDLATYPRTLPRDLEILEVQSVSVRSVHSSDPSIRKPSAVFLPSVQEMYPSGINQDPAAQKGTFIEVKGYGDQMEGKSRPTFFRGVATVVTKLFNAIEVYSQSFHYERQLTLVPAHQCIFRAKRHPTMPCLETALSRSPSLPSRP